MKMEQPNTRRIMMGALGVVLCAGFCFYLVGGWANQNYERIEKRHLVNQEFHELLSRLQLESGLDEVLKQMGGPAGKISKATGVLTSPHELLIGGAAEGKAPLVDYELHEWKRGDCTGVVVFDKEKVVKGKWVFGGGYGNRGSRRLPGKWRPPKKRR